jgi:hypothetical protein
MVLLAGTPVPPGTSGKFRKTNPLLVHVPLEKLPFPEPLTHCTGVGLAMKSAKAMVMEEISHIG